MNKQTFYATATLIGTIVGAGIFGIPYVVMKAGFLVGFFYLVVLGGAVMLIHLLYGEVVLRTHGKHRIVGYAQKYLHGPGKKAALFSTLFGFYGTLLAYLVIGGQFLKIILGQFFGGSEFFWTMVFFAFGAWVIWRGLQLIASFEFFMVIFFGFIVLLFLIMGWSQIDFDNFISFNVGNIFLPYGVILFAVAGSAAIPELRDILSGQEKKMKKVIIFGTLIPAAIYTLFALVVVGVSGFNTSEEAIEGIVPYFGSKVIFLGALFGFLAVIASFLVIGLNLKRVFQYDIGLNHFAAWALACFVPLILYLIGLKSFILIIGIVGAVMVGIEGILLILIYRKADRVGERKPEYDIVVPNFILYILGGIFILGILYQIFYSTQIS